MPNSRFTKSLYPRAKALFLITAIVLAPLFTVPAHAKRGPTPPVIRQLPSAVDDKGKPMIFNATNTGDEFLPVALLPEVGAGSGYVSNKQVLASFDAGDSSLAEIFSASGAFVGSVSISGYMISYP